MVDGYGENGKEEERRKREREYGSPEGFKAGAGLRGSYSTSVRHTNSTWPLFEHPSPRHLLPSFSFLSSLLPSFFVSLSLS